MLSNTKQEIVQMLIKKIESWLESEGNARSTLAGALVVLDTIRVQAPFSETDVFTNDGQLVGGAWSCTQNSARAIWRKSQVSGRWRNYTLGSEIYASCSGN